MTNVKIPLTATRAVRLFKVLNARHTTIDFLLAEGLNNLSGSHTRKNGYFCPTGLNNLTPRAVRGAGAVKAKVKAI